MQRILVWKNYRNLEKAALREQNAAWMFCNLEKAPWNGGKEKRDYRQ